MFNVQKAKRQKLKAVVGFIGASGSGKTLSALLTAYGMMKEKYPEMDEADLWEKIGVLDTEHERSKLYAGMEKAGVRIGEFLHIDFQEPFTTDRYEMGVKALKDAGAEVIVIDSLTHAWEGKGGLLDKQQEYGGNFQAWAKVKPYIQQFIKTLTQSNVHILVTMRTKQDYQIEASETGKLNIKKMGLKPIQKDDLEYEFMINFRTEDNHAATVTKDNSGLFEGMQERITPSVGKKLYQWLEEGIDVKAEEEKERQEKAAYINSLKESNETLAAYINDLEVKAKKKVDDMPLAFIKKMYMLVEQKVEEVEANV